MKIQKARKRGEALADQQMANLREEIELETDRLQRVYRKYGAMAVIFDDGTDPDEDDFNIVPVPIPRNKDTVDYDADWVKSQMTDEEWRRLNEEERQALLMKAKLLERQLKKELYGDEWEKERARLAGDEAALAELERERRQAFEKMMKLRLLNARHRNEINDLTDLGDEAPEEHDELDHIEDKLCADWVKKQMDDEEWRKLSEHERQQLILKSKLAQRALRREMYGDDWQKQLAALQGDEAALEAYRRNQRELFNKRLAAMVALRWIFKLIFREIIWKRTFNLKFPKFENSIQDENRSIWMKLETSHWKQSLKKKKMYYVQIGSRLKWTKRLGEKCPKKNVKHT